MSDQTHITLSDEKTIPQVGLGVWRTPNETAVSAVKAALDTGYRHIDTAAIYENERGVGEGIRASDVARGDIFLTTKIWNDAQGYESTLKAAGESLKRLGTDYVDLLLIHWPSPHRKLYRDTWKALIQLQKDGIAKSIGVSNFAGEHLEQIIADTGVTPVLNQIELHPDFAQHALRKVHGQLGMTTESWSPLGQGRLLDNAVIGTIAAKHDRSPAQVIIRWHIQNGLVVIPKSVTPSRIVENFKVFDFALDGGDLETMARLDNPKGRIGPDPMTAAF